MTAVSEGGESVDMDTEEDASHTTEPKEERDDLINPFWIEDRDLGRGEGDCLSGPEVQFWKDLIEKYLYPIDADKTKQVPNSKLKSLYSAWKLLGSFSLYLHDFQAKIILCSRFVIIVQTFCL